MNRKSEDNTDSQMISDTYCSIYVTHPKNDQAKDLAKKLVEEKLIGCANIIPNVSSIYEWDGNICEEEEVILFLKTKSQLFESCKKRILELHPYTTPAILFLPIENTGDDYLDWLSKQTL